jgi:hypothetical protein
MITRIKRAAVRPLMGYKKCQIICLGAKTNETDVNNDSGLSRRIPVSDTIFTEKRGLRPSSNGRR